MRRARRIAAFGALIVALVIAGILSGVVPVPIGDAAVLHPRERALPGWMGHPGVEAFDLEVPPGPRMYVRGWIVHGTRSDLPWTMICNGNASTIVDMLGIARWFARATGSTAVLWDYRGYGFSRGHAGITVTREDALRVYDAIRARSGRDPVVYGQSFGTTIAAHVAHERPVHALILHAPPASAETLFRAVRDRNFPWFLHAARPLALPDVRDDFAVADTVRTISAPTLVLHGTDDALIPIAEGRAVAQASGARIKRFVAIEHGTHDALHYDGTPAGAAIASFVTRR